MAALLMQWLYQVCTCSLSLRVEGKHCVVIIITTHVNSTCNSSTYCGMGNCTGPSHLPISHNNDGLVSEQFGDWLSSAALSPSAIILPVRRLGFLLLSFFLLGQQFSLVLVVAPHPTVSPYVAGSFRISTPFQSFVLVFLSIYGGLSRHNYYLFHPQFPIPFVHTFSLQPLGETVLLHRCFSFFRLVEFFLFLLLLLHSLSLYLHRSLAFLTAHPVDSVFLTVKPLNKGCERSTLMCWCTLALSACAVSLAQRPSSDVSLSSYRRLMYAT